MEDETLVVRYRCSKCSTPHYEMTEDGKCYRPSCKGDLVDIKQSLSSADIKWHKEAFETFPSVLAHEYFRLYQLCCADNIYGTMLQLKDVIEATIKFLVLTVSAWARKNDIKGREENYEKELANDKLSFGDWITIAGMMERFFNPNRYKGLPLPGPLAVLMAEMPGWARNDDYDFSEWRNKTIGHGALALEDDIDFCLEVADYVSILSEFYSQYSDAFQAIHMKSGDLNLVGKDKARDLIITEGECRAEVSGELIPLKPYIIHSNSGIYFYDEYANRKQQRLLNYPAAKVLFQEDDYFAVLSRILKLQGSTMEKSIDADVITRAEDDFLSLLGAEEKGIKPDDALGEIRKIISSYDKGVFMLEMERGCGKSFLSQKLNSRYEGRWKVSDDVDIRTYHLMRTQYGGVQEFLEGIKSEWEHCYNRGAEASRVRFALEWSRDDQDKNAGFMADYLNHWQKFTMHDNSRLNKPKILLILDGLDEIREKDDEIWSFIPDSSDLNDGVYILLTGRVYDKEELPEYYKNRRQQLKLDADPIRILADSNMNRKFLRKYIESRNLGKLTESQINYMIERAHYRILELTMICNMLKNGAAVSLEDKKDGEIIQAFLKTIEERYGEPKAPVFKALLALMSEVSVYEPLSMREIAELMKMGGIRLELFGMLSDIAPILAVDRSFVQEGNEYHDINRYRLTNEDVISAVRKYLSSEKTRNLVEDLLDFIRKDIRCESPVAYNGAIAFFSHITDLLSRNKMSVFWEAADLEGVYRILQLCIDETEQEDGLKDLRILNLAHEIINIGKSLDLNNREAAINHIIDAYQIVLQVVNSDMHYNKYADDLFALADKTVYSDPVNEAYNLCRAYTELSKSYDDIDSACEAVLRAEGIDDNKKDARFFKAQADAYDAFLRANGHVDPDLYYGFADRMEIAEKAVEIADRMRVGSDQRINLQYIRNYMQYSFELDDNGDTAVAEAYLKMCLSSFLDKEKTVGLSAQEKNDLIGLYMVLGDHYLFCSEEQLAIEAEAEALRRLKSIQHVSVFVTPMDTLFRYYQIMSVAIEACELNQYCDSSIAVDIYFSALNFFESFTPDTFYKSREDIFLRNYGQRLCDVVDSEKASEIRKIIRETPEIQNSEEDVDDATSFGWDYDEEDDETELTKPMTPEVKQLLERAAKADTLGKWKDCVREHLACSDEFIMAEQYNMAGQEILSALMIIEAEFAERTGFFSSGPKDSNEHEELDKEYAYATYKYARFCKNYETDRSIQAKWVDYAEEALDLYHKTNTELFAEDERIIADLNYELGKYYVTLFNRDKVKKHFSMAISIYEKKQIFPERISEMKTWFQEQERFSLRGRLDWQFVKDYQGSDSQKQSDLLKIAVIPSKGNCMFFSRESLLPFIGTNQENSFFDSLLELINGKEMILIFKEGGNYFVNKQEQSSVDAFVSCELDRITWSKAFEELRMKGNLLEKIIDKDADWVGEFFVKLLQHARQKYPQSFYEA